MTAKSKQVLSGVAQQVARNGKRVPIRQNGRIVAALVPADDLKILEEMDRIDARIARQAIAKARSRGEKPIPWGEARKLLKLD
jgi:hypothetical protein